MNRFTDADCAFVFPGAGMEYRRFIKSMSEEHRELLREYCLLAQKETGMDVWKYIHGSAGTGMGEDLLNQMAIYTINCSVYEIYSRQGVFPRVLLGYSMGIYSAIACGGAVTFAAGLGLVVNAYMSMKSCMEGQRGAMGSIIGLSREDVEEMIVRSGCSSGVEIANENNAHSIVITGLQQDVRKVMGLATEEGALKTIEIDVALPYHSRFVEKGAVEFRKYIRHIKIEDLQIPLISCINQSILMRSEDIRDELCANLKSNISWKKSMEKVADLGISKFAEVGAGDSLARISRFIDSNWKFICFEKAAGRIA